MSDLSDELDVKTPQDLSTTLAIALRQSADSLDFMLRQVDMGHWCTRTGDQIANSAGLKAARDARRAAMDALELNVVSKIPQID